MIKKFRKIKNIGKFLDYNATGDVELKKTTIVYGENGRGKTTIAEILRSLANANPQLLSARRTLGKNPDDVEIEIITDQGNRNFKKSAWDNTLSNIEVFDVNFVNENVYSGFELTNDHKRKNCINILGSDAVKIAREIESIKQANVLLENKKRELETSIRAVTNNRINVADFIKLTESPDIESQIKASEQDLKSAQDYTILQRKQRPKRLSFMIGIDLVGASKVLQQSIDGIKQGYIDFVKNKSKNLKNTDSPTDWIRVGKDNIIENKCPFCEQDLEHSHEIIDSYTQFFSAEYVKSRNEINSYSRQFNSESISNLISDLQRDSNTNSLIVGSWKEYIGESYLDIVDFSSLTLRYSHLIKQIRIEFTEKSQDEMTSKSDATVTAINDFVEELTGIVDNYNKSIDLVLSKINEIVTKPAEDTIKLQQTTSNLKLNQQRFSSPAKGWCDNYVATQAQILANNKTVKTKTDDLKTKSASTLAKYGEEINKCLKRFTNDFELCDFDKLVFIGRSPIPQADYNIKHTGTDTVIPAAYSADSASFANFLSEGDKNALALSFFIAKLKCDGNIQNKIIVIDDPLTSFDANRKSETVNILREISGSVNQLIILTHNIFLTKDLLDSLGTADSKYLYINRDATGSVILEWDIQSDTKSQYFKDYDLIDGYINTGARDDDERRKMARAIRPLLENYYRTKFPNEFMGNEWLGDFIAKVKASNGIGVFKATHVCISELESINNYTKQYHHGDNPNADSIPIVDSELSNYAKSALNLIMN